MASLTFSENKLSMMKPFFSSDSSSSSQGAPSKHQTVLSANIHCFDPGSNILWRNILEFSTADYRVGRGLELWKGHRNVFTLPLPPSPRTCGECPANVTFLRHSLKLATKKIRPSTASLCCWFPICSQRRNQILVQTANTNWLEFMPALLVLSQEEKDPKMPSIPQSPQRQWRPQRWTTSWRPPDRWTQGWTLCFSARFENIRDCSKKFWDSFWRDQQQGAQLGRHLLRRVSPGSSLT